MWTLPNSIKSIHVEIKDPLVFNGTNNATKFMDIHNLTDHVWIDCINIGYHFGIYPWMIVGISTLWTLESWEDIVGLGTYYT